MASAAARASFTSRRG